MRCTPHCTCAHRRKPQVDPGGRLHGRLHAAPRHDRTWRCPTSSGRSGVAGSPVVISAYALTLAAFLPTAGRWPTCTAGGGSALGIVIFTVGRCAAASPPARCSLRSLAAARASEARSHRDLARAARPDVPGRDRGMALGLFGAITGVALAIGPVPAERSRRAFLALDLLRQRPHRDRRLTMTLLCVDESRNPNASRPDWAGCHLQRPRGARTA